MATVSDMDRAALREQRVETRRRQVRRRRLTALAIVAGIVVLSALLGSLLSGSGAVTLRPVEAAAVVSPFHSTLPQEIRGVHVTMDLAGIPGKLSSYLALRRNGLNTIELDVKDENGEVGFVKGAPAMAVDDGAARPFYDARATAAQVHRAGVYLIGRVVTFEDPLTAERHPELAVRTSTGAIWHTTGGLAWLNPYSKTAWRYDVDVAVAAAKAGFDEIQFDYVRFPSDGDVSIIRYPGVHTQPMGETVAAFLRYARSRLHPLGVRISADVFGLSATHNLGIGQTPGQIGEVVDTIYPMTYPSHYVSGEYNLPDPNAAPGKTVSYSLRDFRAKLAGTPAQLVPWLQDFSLGRRYTAADVAAQVQAARDYDAGGFMLWNAAGIYTRKALSAGPPPPLPPLYAPHL